MFHLLLIDDSPDDRTLIIRELQREFSDLEIEEITEAKSFNQALTTGNFNLVITDYQIGWIDGITVLNNVKSRYPNCPVVMFTASGDQEVAVEAMKSGLDDYIIKSPKHFVRLPMTVRSAVQRRHEIAERQRIEAALAQEKARYELENRRLRAVLDLLPVGVVIADSEGQILELNAATRKIWGEDAPLVDEMSQYREYKAWWSRTGQLISAEEWALARALNLGEVSLGEEIEIETFDGKRKTILNSAVPIRDETGEIVNAVAVNVDITELKQAELERQQFLAREQAHAMVRESEERYRKMVEFCPDAIFINNGGQIVFANSAALKLFGATSPEQLIGRNVLDHIHSDSLEIVKARIQGIKEGKPAELMEQKWLRLDGTVLNLEVAAIPITYNDQIAAQVIARDISIRKQVEEEVLKALQRERELSDIKSRTITTISHEYRTPLTTIIMSAELLENYPDKLTPEKKLAHLQRIRNSAKYLAQLVNDVLIMGETQAEKVQFNPTPLDLEQFCQEVLEEAHASSNSSKLLQIKFTRHNNYKDACLDEKLLRQILSNLLSNAIKYSPQGGTIRFDLECNDGFAQFSIQDEGIGIPAADLPRLFESFHRASNVGTIRGTGIGLAIVKNCVELHSGKITIESMENVGTTFTVTLPLKYGL